MNGVELKGVKRLEMTAGVDENTELRVHMNCSEAEVSLEGMIDVSSLSDSFRTFISVPPVDDEEERS